MTNDIKLYGLSITKRSNKIRRNQHNKTIVKQTYKTTKKVLIMPFKVLYIIGYNSIKYIDAIVFKSNFKKQKSIYNYLSIPEQCFKSKKKKSNSKFITISNKNKIINL